MADILGTSRGHTVEPLGDENMIRLLPNEHHDYDTRAALGGFRAALTGDEQDTLRAIPVPGIGDCLPARSGRAAIVMALKALGLPHRARIGVPLYCCPVVFKAIKAADCVPRFLDVDPDTYCLSAGDLAAKRVEVDAVIAVHMFGHVCDMPALRSAAPGKPIIEDCAQALGSRLDGHPVGSLGEIGIFSFRLGKYISAGEGAALWSGRLELQSRMAEQIAALTAPGRGEEVLHVMKTWLRARLRTRPLWGLVGVHLWGLYNRKIRYEAQSPLVVARIYKSDLETTLRRLPMLDLWIRRQRQNADFYCRNLQVDQSVLCVERSTAFYNRLQFPLLMPDPEQCADMAARLHNDCIGTARPYKDIALIAKAHYGYTGDCPQAEEIAQTVIVIPCHHGLTRREVQRVAAAVNKAWAESSKRKRDATNPAVPAHERGRPSSS